MSAPGTSLSHVPVLIEETLVALDPRAGEVALDGTAGYGGHAEAIARRLGPGGTLWLCDLDAGNLARAAERVRAVPNAPSVRTHHGSFAEGPREIAAAGQRAGVVLADLGFASPQVDDATRGLSFSRPGPLDMRLDASRGVTAADLVASLSERELADVLTRFGEERQARAVARRIVATRAREPITTTTQLADLVRSVVWRTPGSIDPATRTFQALRIAVNDELGHLAALLDWVDRGARVAGEQAGRPHPDAWLAEGARVAVIAFHSLEDRPVKQAFGRLEEEGLAEVLTPRPITPGEAELGRNPRAGSAKLRAVKLRGRGA